MINWTLRLYLEKINEKLVITKKNNLFNYKYFIRLVVEVAENVKKKIIKS